MNPKGYIKDKLKKIRTRVQFAAGLNNAAPMGNNFRYALYHRFCRANFRRLNKGHSAITQLAIVQAFKKNAVAVLPPTPERLNTINAIPEALYKKFENPAFRGKGELDFMTQSFLSPEEFDSVRDLLSDEIDQGLKSLLGSYYAVVSAVQYRTVPSEHAPRSSFLWHVDDHPDCALKIFFYLTDTYKTNGAIQVHSWKSSRDLKRRGFIDRRRLPPAIVPDLNNETRFNVIEGKRGTAFIFSENAIHKAVIPEQGYRDVLVMEILPSLNPKVQYLNAHLQYWKHPFDLLFPNAHVDEKVAMYA